MEVRVAFDRAVDAEVARRVVGELIGFGEGEKPGVGGRPGGDRGALRVAAAELVDDGRHARARDRPPPPRSDLPADVARGESTGRSRVGNPGRGGLRPGRGRGALARKGGDEAVVVGVVAGGRPERRPPDHGGVDRPGTALALTLKSGKLTLRTLVVLPKGNVPVSAGRFRLRSTRRSGSRPRGRSPRRLTPIGRACRPNPPARRSTFRWPSPRATGRSGSGWPAAPRPCLAGRSCCRGLRQASCPRPPPRSRPNS